MKEKCYINFVCIYLVVKEDIPFLIIQLHLVFNHPIFYIRNPCFHGRNSAMNILGKNRGYDLSVIRKQVDTHRMSFD